MARRRKTRTHSKSGPSKQDDGVPKSFIIKHGQVGSSLSQLVRDLRKVMEPNTASRLKERHRNKLKDYLTMAPALKVTHILAFTLTGVAPSLRIVRLSAGPTLSFRVERYSLIKDMLKSSRFARTIGMAYLTAPLLVLASFPPPSPTTPPHLALVMKAFQSLFPSLSPQSMSLSNARRIVLIAYNPDRGTIDFRHYIITVKPYGVSKRVRRLLEGSTKKSDSKTVVLDLGNEKDVADFLLRRRGEPGPDGEGGYESAASSASSAAGDEGDAVSLADDYVGRNNRKGSRKAVRLDEIGPRMELRLIKIAEGVPGKEGAVMYHEFVKKSKAEVTAQKASHAAKEKLRAQRREEQERNIKRKKEEQEQNKKKGRGAEEDEDEDKDEGESEDDDEDGDEYEDDGDWDEEEEISEGEEDDEGEDGMQEDSDADDSEVEKPPPPKKAKTRKAS